MKLQQYFNEIQSRHNYCMDFNDFSSVLVIYPATLVAMADGEFSLLERQNIISAIKGISDNELVVFEMYRLLNNLLELEVNEKSKLLKIIRDVVADKPSIKKIILDLMISTAESEDGISAEEAAVIEELKSNLSI